MSSLNSLVKALTFYFPWKYWSDLSVISAVVASFSGQKINANSSINLVQEVKTIFPVFISCLTICLVKVAAHPILQYDKA
jgi:hypothetical protein